jgi:hypothetical protein
MSAASLHAQAEPASAARERPERAGMADRVASPSAPGKIALQRAVASLGPPRGSDQDVLDRGSRSLQRSVAARRTTAGRVLARYAHQDCREDDLKNHVWPADYIAKQMVKKAIKALSASTIESSVSALFPKYFMTSTPKIAAMLRVLDKVDVEFRANDYTYECEDDCASNDNGYTWSGIVGSITQSHIHLCIPKFRSPTGDKNDCLARTIVHEFTHRYAGTDDHGYCKSGCGYSSCPSTMTPDQALENADSYACFVYELWPMRLLTAMAEPAAEEPEAAVALA